MEQPKRLYRSTTNRIIGGVCGGIGDYFNIDPTLIRLACVLLCLGGGFGIVVYIVMWIVVPEQGQEGKPFDQRVQSTGQEMKAEAENVVDIVRHRDRTTSRIIIGAILIAVGVMAFGNMFWPWSFFRWDVFWPLIIVAVGFIIILKRK